MLGNLFRDQLDRYGEMEALADEWAKTVAARAGRDRFALNADDPLIADLGRDGDERPREGVVYFGIEDASQALPELQHAFDAKHCRRCGHPYAYERAFVGHLGHYSLPQLRRRAAAAGRRGDARSSCTGWTARASTVRTPQAARSSSSCPCPASTTSTTRWPRSPPALRLGVAPERIAAALRRDARPPSAGSRRSRSAAARSRSC